MAENSAGHGSDGVRWLFLETTDNTLTEGRAGTYLHGGDNEPSYSTTTGSVWPTDGRHTIQRVAPPDTRPAVKTKPGRLAGLLLVAATFLAACGEPGGEGAAVSTVPDETTLTSAPATTTSSDSTTTSLATPTSTQAPGPGDSVDESDYEGSGAPMPHTPEVIVAPGETGLIPLQFEGERGATIMLLLDSYENVTARFGDTPLEVEDMLGADVMGALLENPTDGNLEVTNNGTEHVMGAVIVVLDSPRHLTVSVEPVLAAPGDPVEITVTLTEPAPDDQPVIQVTHPDESSPVELVANLVSPGVWTSTFTPEEAGAYTILARVEGPRPRFDSGWVQVDLEEPAPPATGGGD